jgi:hypothetical protein
LLLFAKKFADFYTQEQKLTLTIKYIMFADFQSANARKSTFVFCKNKTKKEAVLKGQNKP